MRFTGSVGVIRVRVPGIVPAQHHKRHYINIVNGMGFGAYPGLRVGIIMNIPTLTKLCRMGDKNI